MSSLASGSRRSVLEVAQTVDPKYRGLAAVIAIGFAHIGDRIEEHGRRVAENERKTA